MLPLRLVLDTNILVSSALNPDGLQRTVLRLAITAPARLYVSAPILKEFRDVLWRPQLGIRKGLRQQMLQLVEDRSRIVTPRRHLAITRDPADNIFVECAEAAEADYLVTGNLRHFPRSWRKTKIITSRELISLVAPFLVP
jgi:putative PIN family toxin of toxin-antitoxin system